MANIEPIIKDVKSLASYICKKYQAEFQCEISPIKLQKSLYFLFAYWGGFVTKAQNNKNVEVDFDNISPYLFDAEIEAWIYGPVIPEVYKNKDDLLNHLVEGFLEDKKFVKEFIDDLLSQIFKVSDFRLVDISHNDKVWKKYFNKEDSFHNNVMPKEEIVEEYVSRF